MKESEIIIGNDEICRMIGWESNKAYVYKVPNTFPHERETDTGWVELDTQAIGFHTDWNMLIGAYNRGLELLVRLPETAKEILNSDRSFIVNYGIKNFFHLFEGQLHINSCWIKLVDFAKWYNSIKEVVKK